MRSGIAVLIFLASVLYAQDTDPVAWSFGKPTIEGKPAPGATMKVRLAASIGEGWHLYSLKKLEGGPIPTSIVVPPDQAFSLAGAVEAPDPIRLEDAVFGMEVEFFLDSVEFTVPVKLAADLKPGTHKLTIAPRYQTCNGSMCMPPRTVKLELPVEVVSK